MLIFYSTNSNDYDNYFENQCSESSLWEWEEVKRILKININMLHNFKIAYDMIANNLVVNVYYLK